MSKTSDWLAKWLKKDEPNAVENENTGSDEAATDSEDSAATDSDDSTVDNNSDAATDETTDLSENTDTTSDEAADKKDTDKDSAEASKTQEKTADPRAEFDRLAKAFGASFAGEAFAKGMTFEDASTARAAMLAEENAELKERLAAVATAGEATGASASDAQDDKNKGATIRSCIKFK